MKVSEAVSLLKQIIDNYGDLDLQIDHQGFITTLDIESIEVGNNYTGPHKSYAYIYPIDDDANQLITDAVDRGYEEAKRKL